MDHTIAQIQYSDLTSKGQETFNYQKLTGVLADYGLECCRLYNDDNGADLLAYRVDHPPIAVQLKGRPTIDRKYIGKGLLVAFPTERGWYLYPHDGLVRRIDSLGKSAMQSDSWRVDGLYSWSHSPTWLREWLAPYLVGQNRLVVTEPEVS